MDYEKMKSCAEAMEMPEDMKQRVVRNCKAQMMKAEGEKNGKRRDRIGKPAVLAAAMMLCLLLTATGLAAAGVLQGFFRNVEDTGGAVVGTVYELATDEINVVAAAEGNVLKVTVCFAEPGKLPYASAERMGIATYRILDANGAQKKEGATDAFAVTSGETELCIDLDGMGEGSYTLVIEAFFAEKKADQPLQINGSWTCTFSK